jgi:hypothetical protein
MRRQVDANATSSGKDWKLRKTQRTISDGASTKPEPAEPADPAMIKVAAWLQEERVPEGADDAVRMLR